MTSYQISDAALSLLLKQNLSGRYALSFFDLRHVVTDGKAIISSFSEYEASTGACLPPSREGLSLLRNGSAIIFYNDKVQNLRRVNWTIAHELGHIFLGHKTDGNREQSEADRFAAELLIPEAAVRFLDCSLGSRLSPQKMQSYFSASFSACKRRRAQLDRTEYIPSEKGNELVKRIFFPFSETLDSDSDIFISSVL